MARGERILPIAEFLGQSAAASATELPLEIAAAALNCDFDGRSVAKRPGMSDYGTALPGGTNRFWGISAYFPAGGAAPMVVAAGNTGVYADVNRDGDFGDAGEALATGLTGGTHMDFWQHRSNLFFGNAVDGVYRWPGSGAAALVVNLTAPAALTLAPSVSAPETFESGTWTSTNAALTGTLVDEATSADDKAPKQGTKCLRLRATASGARGKYVHKSWAGGNQDLSKAVAVEIWVLGARSKLSFQVAIYANGETVGNAPQWDKFPTYEVKENGAWTRIRVPITGVTRTASPGMAIRFVDDGGREYGANLNLFFDDLKLIGPLPADRYQYYATYRVKDAGGTVLDESGPSAVSEITIAADAADGPGVAGISLTHAATVQSGVTHIGIYRKRTTGVFATARLVREVANASATVVDTMDDGELAKLAVEGAAPRVPQAITNPPKAAAFSLVNRRTVAGNVTVGGVNYPNRVMWSRWDMPGQFSGLGTGEEIEDGRAAGWADMDGWESIVRVVPFERYALIFTQRSIWTLYVGVQPGELELRRRADVGLDAREAVAILGGLVFFLSGDGVRALRPGETDVDGQWRSWIISEPANPSFQFASEDSRAATCMALDPWDRLLVHCRGMNGGIGGSTWVFYPSLPGALDRQENPARPGWAYWEYNPVTYFPFSGWTHMFTVPRGSGHGGGLLAGGFGTGELYWVGATPGSGAPLKLESDWGEEISWRWRSRPILARELLRSERASLSSLTALVDAQPNKAMTAGVYGETDLFTPLSTGTLSLGTQATGTKQTSCRFSPAARGAWLQVDISGTQGVAMRVRRIELGVYRR